MSDERPDAAYLADLLARCRAEIKELKAERDALRQRAEKAEASDAESIAMYRRARDRAGAFSERITSLQLTLTRIEREGDEHSQLIARAALEEKDTTNDQ